MSLRRWWMRRVARWYHLRGAAHRHLGNARGDGWEHRAAVEDFTRALVLDSTFGQAHLDRGILYWRELDEPRRAIDDLSAALAVTPTLHEALFNRGIAYQQLGDFAAAVADFRAYLSVGTHPYWREYAERMLVELIVESEKEGK